MLNNWVWECDWSKEKAYELRKENYNYSLEAADILNYVKDIVHLASSGMDCFAQREVNHEVRANARFSCVHRCWKRFGRIYV